MQFFTLTGTWGPVSPSGEISGFVELQMLVENDGVLAVPANSLLVIPTPESTQVQNNVMVPIQLLANTTDLNISGNLYYTATFKDFYYTNDGESVVLNLSPITFQAPTNATTIDLSAVAPAAGATAVQIAASYLGAITSQAAMLALTGKLGDYCYRSDLNTFYYLIASPPTSLSSWASITLTLPPTVDGGTPANSGTGFTIDGGTP
jgi:hypothetical protein